MEEIILNKKVVIFGAGGGGIKVAAILKGMGYVVAAFIDSDPDKWNTLVMGIEVKDMHWLMEVDYPIIIASIGEAEIVNKLTDLGLNGRIALKEQYIMEYASGHMKELDKYKGAVKHREKHVILSSETGFQYWGVEQYTRVEAEMLLQNGVKLSILAKLGMVFKDDQLKENIVEIAFDTGDYWDVIKSVVEYISMHLPCTVQDNWQNYTLIGAVLAKSLFPDDVKIVSLVHNDLSKFSKIVQFFQDEVDYIGGVSRDIYAKLRDVYNISPDKLIYRESPIRVKNVLDRNYAIDEDTPIRIGYAGRIEKRQKRTHLLFEVIHFLEEQKVKYHLDIAGYGVYLDEFLEELNNMRVSHNAGYVGVIENEKMDAFWQEHDIFISVSEFEGASIAMLEAMMNGCVPVVTETSGVREYIVNGQNGYICGAQSIEEVGNRIKYLADDRGLLVNLGTEAGLTVREKCNVNKQFEYYKKILSLEKI